MLWLFTKIKLKKYDVVKSKGERIQTIIYSRIARNISCFGCVMFAHTWGKSSWLKLLVSAEDPTAMVVGEKPRLATEIDKSRLRK